MGFYHDDPLGVYADAEYEMMHEDEIGQCEHCGKSIRKGDECFGFVTHDGYKILLCGCCDVTPAELLSMLDIDCWDGDAEDVNESVESESWKIKENIRKQRRAV